LSWKNQSVDRGRCFIGGDGAEYFLKCILKRMLPENKESFHMITLLFVDDEENFLESMKKRLEARGIHVIALNRGIKAIEAARKNPVDIAIVDLKMPGMNGDEVLQALKREHPWIEIIVLTGHGGIDQEFQCMDGGAYAYLHKPCSLEDILDAVAKAYKRRLTHKLKIKVEQIDGFIDAENPKANALGALKAMVKFERNYHQ
jgi:DNA-binding NtrC family response regulator